MKTKLTTVEKRALNLCQSIIRNEGGQIDVVWSKSAMYGMNPRIEYHGEKCTNVSGCGYDKLSQCLADCLRFLAPIDSEIHGAIHGTGGAGESSTEKALLKTGWKLEKLSSGKTWDSYQLSMA
jgi:hypothetical protein